MITLAHDIQLRNHGRPENSKKYRPKKLVKSISGNFFSIFFINTPRSDAQKINSEISYYFTSVLAWTSYIMDHCVIISKMMHHFFYVIKYQIKIMITTIRAIDLFFLKN